MGCVVAERNKSALICQGCKCATSIRKDRKKTAMEKLIFVYNKDNGFMNGIFDFFHKLIKPDTYNCSLCMVTYNYFGMRQAWKTYLNSLPFEQEFYHKNEFDSIFLMKEKSEYPAIFFQKDDLSLVPLVSREELNQSDLVELMKLINDGLKSLR